NRSKLLICTQSLSERLLSSFSCRVNVHCLICQHSEHWRTKSPADSVTKARSSSQNITFNAAAMASRRNRTKCSHAASAADCRVMRCPTSPAPPSSFCIVADRDFDLIEIYCQNAARKRPDLFFPILGPKLEYINQNKKLRSYESGFRKGIFC